MQVTSSSILANQADLTDAKRAAIEAARTNAAKSAAKLAATRSLGLGPGATGATDPNAAAKILARLGPTDPNAAPTIRALPDEVATGELTVEGLMANWGTSDADYDLDRNGTVDMRDLVTLLSRPADGQTPPPIDASALFGASDPTMRFKPLPTDPQTPVIAGPKTEPTPGLEPGAPDPGRGAGGTTVSPEIDPRTSVPGVDPGPDAGPEVGPVARSAPTAPTAPAAAAAPTGTTDPKLGAIDPAVAPDAASRLSTTAPEADPGKQPVPSSEAASLLGGIMKAWGSDEAEFDLDGDGTVGMNDLLTALSDIAASGESLPAGVQDMLNAWGSDDPAWDLDGDGTVGMSDLLAMLSQGSGSGDGDEDAAPAGAATVDGFAAAWGGSDPMYDLDGDGTVGMNDLLAFLAQSGTTGDAPLGEKPTADPSDRLAATLDAMKPVTAPSLGTTASGGPVDPASAAPVPAGSLTSDVDPSMPKDTGPALDARTILGGPGNVWSQAARLAGDGSTDLATMAGLGDPDVGAASLDTPEKAADALAGSLRDRLAAHGFTDAPPSNLHEILDGLRLDAGDRSMVLDRLERAWPDGLGLSITA